MLRCIHVEWWCTYCAVIELLILLSRHWIACNCYCMMFCSMLSAYYFVCDVIPLPIIIDEYFLCCNRNCRCRYYWILFILLQCLPCFNRFWCVMQGVTIYWKRNELPTKVVRWEMRKPIVQNFPGIESSISLRQKASSMLQAVSSPRQSISFRWCKVLCPFCLREMCVCVCVLVCNKWPWFISQSCFEA